MSSYVHKKALRIPAQKIIEAMGASDLWDLEEKLGEKIKEHCFSVFNDKKTGFEVNMTDKEQYLDYVLSYDGNSSCGDFGNASLLSTAEKEKAKEIFDLLGIEYNLDDIHYVDYCYYNGCEAADCYSVPELRF